MTLREFFENISLSQRLKAGCPQVADEISWDKLVTAMQRSYEEAIDDLLPRPSLLVATGENRTR